METRIVIDYRKSGENKKLYLSSAHYADLPHTRDSLYPNANFIAVLEQNGLPDFERHLSIGLQESEGRTGYGSIIIQNYDGVFDELKEACFGRPCKIYRGKAGHDTAIFQVILTGMIERAEVDENQVAFHLRDRQAEIGAFVLNPTLYSGTNNGAGTGFESTIGGLKGQNKPIGFGRCFNIPALLVNEADHVFEVGPFANVRLARDQGIALTHAGDYATPNAMLGAVLNAGEYCCCPASGYIRLAQAPSGIFTCDIDFESGIVAMRAGKLAEKIFRQAGLNIVDINQASLDALDQAFPYPMGYWSGAIAANVADVLRVILAGIGAVWTDRQDGMIEVIRLVNPQDLISKRVLTASDMLGPIKLLQSGYEIPAASVKIGYGYNHQILKASDLDNASDEGFRIWASEAYRYETFNNNIAQDWPHAKVASLDTAIANPDGAMMEATRLADFLKTPIHYYQVDMHASSAQDLELGERVDIALARFGWGTGKSMQIIGKRDKDNNISLFLLG